MVVEINFFFNCFSLKSKYCIKLLNYTKLFDGFFFIKAVLSVQKVFQKNLSTVNYRSNQLLVDKINSHDIHKWCMKLVRKLLSYNTTFRVLSYIETGNFGLASPISYVVCERSELKCLVRHEHENMKIFLRRLNLSRFLAKTLRIKNYHESLLKNLCGDVVCEARS